MTYEDFQKYDAENPQVWEMFVRFTFEAINAGRKHFSSEAIINRIRFETLVSGNDEFKVNNNLKPFFSRKFMEIYPQHQGFFETRKSKAEKNMSNSDTCDKCPTQIMWLKHKVSGKPAPIEVEPHPRGNILIKGNQYRVATEDEKEIAKNKNIPLYANHFWNCEFSKEFKKK